MISLTLRYYDRHGRPQQCGPPVLWNGTAQSWYDTQRVPNSELPVRLRKVVGLPHVTLWDVGQGWTIIEKPA